jgi:glycine dehydrogenase subunit 2
MEPTETESKDGLDRYIEVVKASRQAPPSPADAPISGAPYPPRRRWTRPAARQPVLRWKPEAEERRRMGFADMPAPMCPGM